MDNYLVMDEAELFEIEGGKWGWKKWLKAAVCVTGAVLLVTATGGTAALGGAMVGGTIGGVIDDL